MYWNTATPNHIHIVYGSFPIQWWLSSYDRNHMACKDFSIYYMALHKQSLPTPDLDHSIGLESHRPLPFPPGTELILEEAFTTDCGNSEDGAFFLKRQKHTLWRERKGKGAGQQGPFCDTTLQWRLASGGKMSGWMRLSCV